jgi:hypothetical protein
VAYLHLKSGSQLIRGVVRTLSDGNVRGDVQYRAIVALAAAMSACSTGGGFGSLPRVATDMATCPILTDPIQVDGPLFGCPGGAEIITRVAVLIDPRGRVSDASFTADSENAGPEHQACVLDALRTWQYTPARDCEGIGGVRVQDDVCRAPYRRCRTAQGRGASGGAAQQ